MTARTGRDYDVCGACGKDVWGSEPHDCRAYKGRKAPAPFAPDAARFAATQAVIEAEPPAALVVATTPTLPTLERVKALLALCLSVDEAKDFRDRAVAYAAYWKQREDSLEIQNQAAEARLRAERRIGELLKAMPKNKGGRPSETCPSAGGFLTLDEIGITRQQASIWQRIAKLAEPDFEDRIAEAQENGLELTTTRVLRGNDPPPAKPPRKAAPESTPAEALVAAAEAAPAEPQPTDLGAVARQLLHALTREEVDGLIRKLQGGEAKDEIAERERRKAEEDAA